MPQVVPHSVLLGGIGGDSHSVGLITLRQALRSNGFRVYYLGTQNRLQDFCELAHFCNVVMISNMDGHARHYLREFQRLVIEFNARRPLWCLGGNLTVGDGFGYEEYFLSLGFDRVYVKFVDISHVLRMLKADLQDVEPIDAAALMERGIESKLTTSRAISQCSDDQVPWDVLLKERKHVLEHWRTGSGAADLASNAEYLAKQPMFSESLHRLQQQGGKPLVQPRSGVAKVEEQIRLFEAFKTVGANTLSYQVDSLTRNNNYAGVEEAFRDQSHGIESSLNGFPVVNHGVPVLRNIAARLKMPLQTRHSTKDPRLLAEISYAGGITAYEGGAICYNVPYYKNYPLDDSIKVWQYVDRLTGYYYDKFGIVLDREFFGTLTATLIPPCIAIVVNLLEAILAVSQGVKSVSLGYAEQGNRVQDIAAIRVLTSQAREILTNLGYADVRVSTVFYQYMAAFPGDTVRSEQLIFESAKTAHLSGATRVITKTPVEALKIPSLADNVHSINLVRRAMTAERDVACNESAIIQECEILRGEVDNLLNSVFECEHGSVTNGIVKAFQLGYLDIPFAPSVHNAGRVITIRDAEGAVRFLDSGSLKLNADIKQFHKEKVQERRRREGLRSETKDYLLIEKDVLSIARGQYEKWPLYE